MKGTRRTPLLKVDTHRRAYIYTPNDSAILAQLLVNNIFEQTPTLLSLENKSTVIAESSCNDITINERNFTYVIISEADLL